MSLPRYQEYKDSGVAWLGKVPAHWQVRRLKHCLSLLTEKAETSINKVALENIQSWSGNYLPTDSEFEGDGVAFSKGDILFGKLRPYLAKAYLAESSGEAVGDFHVMRPRSNVSPRFAQYQILNRDFIELVDGSTFGSKMPRASWEFVGNMPFPLPKESEQTAITSFLDRETAKIDTLIAEQEKLLTLLAEKRQATISHAVTKGLNPYAPMKYSGVEWLGEVPAHWDVLRVKHLVARMEQGWSPQCEGFPVQSWDEWGVLKVGCVNGGFFRPDENKTLPSDLVPLPELGLVSGDLLISRANTRELVGSAAVVFLDYPKLMLCDKLYRLRLRPDSCDPSFLALYLGTPQVRGQIEFAATGASSSMLNIGQSTILEIKVAVPPAVEQTSITAFVNTETTRLDSLTAEATRAIDLLKERRTALISAAVTGKIDVREAVEC